jgi:hypothetical protein
MPGKVKLMKNTSGVLNRYGNSAIRQQDEVRMKKGIRVMVLNNTFNNFQLYRGSRFHWWRKPLYLEENFDLPQVADEIYRIMHRKHLA